MNAEPKVQDITNTVEDFLQNLEEGVAEERGEGEKYSGQVREVILFGNPLLREPSAPVPEVTEDVQKLAADLTATMFDYGGAGIAAPQIGRNLRVVVLRDNPREELDDVILVRAMVNPVILSREGSFSMLEGCLSIPGARGTVERSATVVVSYLDLQGEAQEKELSGYQAAAVQHELDHLDGKLFVDHLSAFQKSRALEKHRKVMKKAYRQAKRSL